MTSPRGRRDRQHVVPVGVARALPSEPGWSAGPISASWGDQRLGRRRRSAQSLHVGLPAHLLARALARRRRLRARRRLRVIAYRSGWPATGTRPCRLMLAGAVNCADDLFIHVASLPSGAQPARPVPSLRCRCRRITREARPVALRRVVDAERCGDRILRSFVALACRTTVAAGFLVLGGGQVRALRAAYREADWYADISMVECHAARRWATPSKSTHRRVFAGGRRRCRWLPQANLGTLLLRRVWPARQGSHAALRAGILPLRLERITCPALEGMPGGSCATPSHGRVLAPGAPWRVRVGATARI